MIHHHCYERRRGSTYVIVVGSTLLIAVFMMAGLMIIKTQRFRFQNEFDTQQARLNAESALDLGLHFIRSNPTNWRDSSFVLTNEYGTNPELQLQMVDPYDGDVANSYEDPVVLLATGTSGAATQKIRLRLNLDTRGYDCLQSAIHAGRDITISSSTVITDGTTSYDESMTVQQNSNLNSEVLGMYTPSVDPSSQISGNITTPGDLPKDMPTRVGVNVVQLYANTAVAINLSDLYESDHALNRLQNSGFEDGLEAWQVIDCDLGALPGGAAVSNRQSHNAGIAQDVRGLMYNGGTFRLQCNFDNQFFFPMLARIRLRLESAVDGVQYFSTGYELCSYNEVTPISGNVTPTWNGQLISATWTVTTSFGAQGDYDIYQPGITEITYPDGAYAMRNALLAPNFNQFGSGTKQTSGLYKLDADGKQVFIENSKINSTFIIQNSDNVTLRHSVAMANSVYNFPTLLADGNLKIGLGDSDLNEAIADINFNPTELPYYAIADSDLDDTYQTRIDGLVYVNGDLEINGNLKSDGVWLVDDELVIDGAQVDITHDELYYNEPPPGFVDVQDMKILPGSIQQVVGN